MITYYSKPKPNGHKKFKRTIDAFSDGVIRVCDNRTKQTILEDVMRAFENSIKEHCGSSAQEVIFDEINKNKGENK